jgi:hypothetical protein
VPLNRNGTTPLISGNLGIDAWLNGALGPAVIATISKNGKKMAVSAPTGPAQSIHFATEIGQAVSSAIRSGLQP